ncbi:hypothetical protein HQ29_00835 [Porphyromonas canoris]|uniref:hypothetical protein n=1 Tax=Porphyromonas canoris TaxID=36875 RepID=UPI00051CD0B2|nr:hypothetical protein [Porphyromonas canoris]KGL53940.1 hypothetical protein HQ29_00835 [Porphyromonas canoris]
MINAYLFYYTNVRRTAVFLLFKASTLFVEKVILFHFFAKRIQIKRLTGIKVAMNLKSSANRALICGIQDLMVANQTLFLATQGMISTFYHIQA